MQPMRVIHPEDNGKVSREEIRKVIWVYKVVSGFEHDKAWDKIYYSRSMKASKMLIEFLGSWKWAADCVQEIYEDLTDNGFSCTLETVIKHAPKWKRNKQEQVAKQEKQGGDHGIRSLPRF